MFAGMTAVKIAVSLPEPLVRNARKAVRIGRAASVSAYIAQAMEEKAKQDDLGALLDEMLAESGGPPTRAEILQADRSLGIARRAPR